MRPIKLVDLSGQYGHIQSPVDQAIKNVIGSAEFIQGKAVLDFESHLSDYLGGSQVISCGNGTDALQIAMMALNFKPGDEVILPVYTYVATAEVIALLGLKPVFVDVTDETFTIDAANLEKHVTSKTVAVVPVHLYGQCADLQPILDVATKYNIHVIEDAAQSLGAEYKFQGGSRKKSGTVAEIGITSFFPTKTLGAFGDGGAMITQDASLAEKVRMIANHGQRRKYHHEVIGVNSRLDTIQAAILDVKLRYMEDYSKKRVSAADYYDARLKNMPLVRIPTRAPWSTHVFHQYTLQVNNGKRDSLRAYLQEKKIPTMIYYPVPLHLQNAYKMKGVGPGSFPVSEKLSHAVLSLPIHTEMDEEQLSYICDSIEQFG